MSRNERGLSESVSWALLVPGLMLVVLGTIQVGIWLHGRNVAANAASAGADLACTVHASDAAARDAALAIAQAGGLQSVSVQITRDGTSVRVTVSGTVAQPFDLGLGTLRESATMPVERLP